MKLEKLKIDHMTSAHADGCIYRGDHAMGTSTGEMIDGRSKTTDMPRNRQRDNQQTTDNTTRDGYVNNQSGTIPPFRAGNYDPFTQYVRDNRRLTGQYGGHSLGEKARQTQTSKHSKQGPCKWFFQGGQFNKCESKPALISAKLCWLCAVVEKVGAFAQLWW